MPTIKSPCPLFTAEDGQPTNVISSLGENAEVISAGKAFTQIKLVDRLGQPQGWVFTDTVDFTRSAPVEAIKLPDFATECWLQALYFGVNAHFLAAVAMTRSNLDNSQDPAGTGPYRFTQSQFNAASSDDAFAVAFAPRNISSWRIQCVVFALTAARALKSYLEAHQNKMPTAIELYVAWLGQVGEPAPADDQALQALTARLGKGIDDTRAAILAAGKAMMDGPADKDMLTGAAGSVPAAQGQVAGIDLTSIDAAKRPIATQIANSFAQAGYGLIHQIAAIANAIRESNLNPGAKAAGSEDSWGLFQLNRRGGVGSGHSADELKDPARNIALIINEANKFPAFKAAVSLADAISVFVRKVERPANQPNEIAVRLRIAEKLVA